MCDSGGSIRATLSHSESTSCRVAVCTMAVDLFVPVISYWHVSKDKGDHSTGCWHRCQRHCTNIVTLRRVLRSSSVSAGLQVGQRDCMVCSMQRVH